MLSEAAKPETQTETLEAMQTRHRKEKRELQGRITSKKKNATKKTRKSVNDECADMERRLADKQEAEISALVGTPEEDDSEKDGQQEDGVDVISKAVEEVKIAEPGPQPQVPGKKRNRQKERLARRQAEQLAAAEAAENEAGDMVDHRAVEREAMSSTFKSNSLVEREIRPDGHCLFSAVADQLESRGVPLRSAPGAGEDGPGYKVVRKAAASWIEQHGDDFAPFLEEELGSYVERMRDTAEWGGHLELLALARAYNLEINVVRNGPTEKIEAGEEGGGGRGGDTEKIWLAYYRHGYGLGEHYNSLRTATP